MSDELQNDLRDLCVALGMGEHARPQSPHEVFQDALSVLKARLGPPAEPAPRLSRREKATIIAEAAANRWDAFHDRNGIHWLSESILAFKTEEDDRIIGWANRSVREVQESAFGDRDRLQAALSALVGSLEGVSIELTDEQERAYEAAASLLDDLSPYGESA